MYISVYFLDIIQYARFSMMHDFQSVSIYFFTFV